MPVEETEKGTHILSSRDLCCLPFLQDLTQAGVASLKIEGRMKTPYYVATVVGAYRRKIDGTADDQILERELAAVSHRPYCSGFYFGQLAAYKPDATLPYISECSFAGTVIGTEPGQMLIEQRGKFSVGDRLEIVSPDSLGLGFTVEQITDEKGQELISAPHAMQKVWVNCPVSVSAGDLVRKRLNEKE